MICSSHLHTPDPSLDIDILGGGGDGSSVAGFLAEAHVVGGRGIGTAGAEGVPGFSGLSATGCGVDDVEDPVRL